MATLGDLIGMAQGMGASDAHIEPGMPLTLRVRGQLQMVGAPLPSRQVITMAREIVGESHWGEFLERCSHDASTMIKGVRCRVNVLQTSRGVGMAIRLLSSFHASVEKLNLHPTLSDMMKHQHGLVLVSGPTGSGKSTSIAALLEEINQHESRHIITIEHPIEYTFRPRKSLIRQREVGRDTPSFAQALLDAMREDPDVIVVGEMRQPETMRLTLNAAETGHLVISTLHSSTCAEALQRIVSAFPAEIQGNVCSQLAECLVGVVCQRLGYRADLDLRVPECEILMATTGVRSLIRQGHFSRLANAIETGGEHGMWSFQRYKRWLDHRKEWHLGTSEVLQQGIEPHTGFTEEITAAPLPTQTDDVTASLHQEKRQRKRRTAEDAPRPTPTAGSQSYQNGVDDGVLVLEAPDDDLEAAIAAIKKGR